MWKEGKIRKCERMVIVCFAQQFKGRQKNKIGNCRISIREFSFFKRCLEVHRRGRRGRGRRRGFEGRCMVEAGRRGYLAEDQWRSARLSTVLPKDEMCVSTF